MYTLMRKNVHKKFLMAAVPYVLGQHYTIIVGLNAHRNRKTMIISHVVYAQDIKKSVFFLMCLADFFDFQFFKNHISKIIYDKSTLRKKSYL